MKASEFITELKKQSKPRNFVAKNAKMGGAGQHKDKKKAEKQGDVKHKKELATTESALSELSTDKLAQYKKAAGADAKKADADGNYARGDKRFKGINRATNKQFDNDLKKHKQQGVAEGDSGAKYRVRSIGHDAKGDYYVSPSTGKKVYKKGVKVGDHENPKTGEHKGVAEDKKPTYPQIKSPKNYDPDWIKKLSKEKLDAIAGPRYKKDKKEQGKAKS